MVVRLADTGIDAPAVTEIYRPVVEASHVSLEEIPPIAVAMERRMRRTLERMPWLVVDLEGAQIGEPSCYETTITKGLPPEEAKTHELYLRALLDGEVGGYAYAAPHRERPAYRWSVDIPVYLAEHHRGRGFGRHLYEELVALLSRQASPTSSPGSPSPTLRARPCIARSGCAGSASTRGSVSSWGSGGT